MPHNNSTGSDQAQVRAVIDAITAAVREKDVEALLSRCASEIATFDLVPPLKHEGTDAIRELWTQSLAAFVPPIEYEVHELDLIVGGDVAFGRSLNRFGGTQTNGKRIVNWLCSTLGLRKIDDEWKVVHQHVSVPFDMKSGKAMLNMEPQAEAQSA